MKLLVTGLLISLIFFASSINAQPFFAVSTGISKDLNNKKPFYAVPVTFRWKPFKRSGFFIEATNEIAFNRLTNANAYTANAQLPEHVVLIEKIRPSAFSMDIGSVIRLYTNKKNNQLALNLSLGICDEYFAVNYRNYDEVNYEVLNPDVAKDFSGVYGAIASVYSFHKRKQDMFIMLRLQSPSSAGPGDRYVLSYDQTAPVQLTFGYNLFYKKL